MTNTQTHVHSRTACSFNLSQRHFPLVYVEWEDSRIENSQMEWHEASSLPSLMIRSVGFLISENDVFVKLTQDIIIMDDGTVDCRSILVIPSGNVKLRKVIPNE